MKEKNVIFMIVVVLLALNNYHALTHLKKLAYRVYPLSLISVIMNL